MVREHEGLALKYMYTVANSAVARASLRLGLGLGLG